MIRESLMDDQKDKIRELLKLIEDESYKHLDKLASSGALTEEDWIYYKYALTREIIKKAVKTAFGEVPKSFVELKNIIETV